jgi:hypothetical protein
MSESRSNPDAGASDSEDRSWPLVIVETILLRAQSWKETAKMAVVGLQQFNDTAVVLRAMR